MSYEPVPNEDPDLDNRLDHDSDDDDDDDDEKVNTTQPFQPGASSTPYHHGEAHEMTQLPREQSGGDTASIDITGDRTTKIAGFRQKLKALFPKANLSNIVIGIGIRKGNVGQAVALGPRSGEYRIFKDSGGITEPFAKRFGSYLGPPAEDIIREDRESLAETNQRLKAAQQQEQSFNATVEKQQQALQERQAKENALEQINQRLANLENEGGTVMERQNEIDRLKREVAKLKRDIKVAKDAEKQYAQTIKERAKASRVVERLQRQYNAQQQKLSAEQARLNRTKPLDELEKDAEEIKRKIEEDRQIMNDKDATPQERMDAGNRFSENTDELARLAPQIQEREQELPLRERIKNVFKKYGWTLQAVALAVGIVLSALALAATNGLKAGTKTLGNGLKAIGQKLGSLLPGLIGSIVCYIFKAAGSVLSFLGGARLAAYPRCGGLLHGKAAQEETLSSPTTARAPTTTRVLFA